MESDGSIAQASRSLKDLFNSVPLFSGFPPKVIEELQGAASVVTIDPDQVILNQGEINHNLYFLVLGTVDIFVDGGLVATLRRKGDLLGEMSVITNKPCSATIIAKTPVELICVNTDVFQEITAENQAQFNHILYRIYSTILTDKVHLTNQKAKRLEETFGALERAKNELQEINTQLERRVVERTQALQQNLDHLLNKNLLPLKTAIEESLKQAGPELQAKLNDCHTGVDAAIQIIEPLIQRFQLEGSMKNRKVLLGQGERKSQTVSRMALGGTGIRIETVQASNELKTKVAESPADIVIIDDDGFAIYNDLQNASPKSKFIYLSTKPLIENLSAFQTFNSVPNIISVDLNDRSASLRLIMTAVIKLIGGNLFGLEKYLAVGVDVQELNVNKSEDRPQYIQQVRDHFAAMGIRGSQLDTMALVLEELLMNSIYDAPHDSTGKPIYNHLPRSTAVELQKGQEARCRFASDGAYMAISVEDPFGALKPDLVMKYLDSCYNGKAGSLNEGKGGAGRGLHQIVENSDFVVFNVAAGRRTEIIAFISLLAKQDSERRPMLNYFSQ